MLENYNNEKKILRLFSSSFHERCAKTGQWLSWSQLFNRASQTMEGPVYLGSVGLWTNLICGQGNTTVMLDKS